MCRKRRRGVVGRRDEIRWEEEMKSGAKKRQKSRGRAEEEKS